MARRYYCHPLPPAGPVTLSPNLGHHLGRVVRTQPGDAVVLFDGAGHEAAATVLEVRGRDVLVEVGAVSAQPLGRSPRIAHDVAIALPKNRADWLLEHGTEVGIRTFRPILTERANRLHERRAHWHHILVAACAQCDRAVLPVIEPVSTLAELCASPLPAERYVATVAASELGAATTGTCLLVVGPEGGLTQREIGMLTEAGFVPRSLGPLTLRSETAVLAGATRLLQAPFASS
jgi:16S rRNA (uracil1498-N3)-methyltransferase